MITPREIREFAAACERWAAESENPSHREIMMRIAKGWRSTAAHLEKHLGVLPNLRDKLD